MKLFFPTPWTLSIPFSTPLSFPRVLLEPGSRSSLSPFIKNENRLQLSAPAASGDNPKNSNEAHPHNVDFINSFFCSLIIFSIDLSDRNSMRISLFIGLRSMILPVRWRKSPHPQCLLLSTYSGWYILRIRWRDSVIFCESIILFPDLNPRESENEAVSNSLEREIVATLSLRQGSPTHEGYSDKFIILIRRLEREKARIIYPGRRREGLPDISMNEVVKSLNHEQREYTVRGGEGASEVLKNELNLTIGEDKMKFITPLKTSLLNLWTTGMEFQVKFILKYVADFFENVIKLRNADDQASLPGFMLLLANRRTPRIVDWSQVTIDKRVRKLRELGLFSRVDVDMVNALSPRTDAAENEALRRRIENLGADVIEVKSELRSLRESVNNIGRKVELSPSKMMEELHRFMSIINEKYRKGANIQKNSGETNKTRSEIFPTKSRGDLQKVGQKMCNHSLMGDTRTIKSLRSVRRSRRKAAKDLEKCVVIVTMIDLRRLPDVVKSEILQNLWDVKKDLTESVVKIVLHEWNRKQLCSLKSREWVDESTLLTYAERRKHNSMAKIWNLSTWFHVEVVGKGSPPDKLYCYSLVENECGGDITSCEKVHVVNVILHYYDVRLITELRCRKEVPSGQSVQSFGLHKAFQYGYKDKYK
ncbi:hypothetical protein M9H77_36007 [Catharanthus roseus]|uniref:Uncharacterized protein n=1 Tax=Catharanthus roseus TaxID=4058 RepID=A0ACB9ZQL8_CATRO|nr:hypothetical protein M9H77_36007 [Catharanthus roseus]